MTGHTELIKSEKPSGDLGFVETKSASNMLIALRRARAKAKITMISGAPGVGKSETIQHFKRTHAPDAIIFQATAAEGGAWNLACALFSILGLGIPNARDLPRAREDLSDAIGPNGFLIIDEAQYLVQRNPHGRDNPDCLEWVRSMSENGCFGLAFVGDLKLDDIILDLPQLRRRTRPGVVISNVTKQDVVAFCHHKGLKDKQAIDALARITKSNGGLGDLAEIFATASDMNKGDVPTADDVFAALELLGGREIEILARPSPRWINVVGRDVANWIAETFAGNRVCIPTLAHLTHRRAISARDHKIQTSTETKTVLARRYQISVRQVHNIKSKRRDPRIS